VTVHRGLLHHVVIDVSDLLSRASPFYGAVLRYLGYEQGDRSATFEDWERWDLGPPHEISIVQVARWPSGTAGSATCAGPSVTTST
jgi:hypothetical protein